MNAKLLLDPEAVESELLREATEMPDFIRRLTAAHRPPDVNPSRALLEQPGRRTEDGQARQGRAAVLALP